MRQLRLISTCLGFVAAIAACSSSKSNGSSADAPGATPDASTDLVAPTQGFQVRSPDIVIPAGKEITYCWYFHTPNTAEVAVKSWQSRMTPGSHHMILYFTGTAQQPDNTLDPTGNCGGAGAGGGSDTSAIPIWTYSAQSEDNEADMPSDDGTGKPVGMTIPANQPAYFQLHYLNATDNDLTVHATLNANTYDAGVAYTKAAAYITYQYSIKIPPAMNGVDGKASFGGTCDVSTATGISGTPANFFTMSTHSHKQSIETTVMDGSSMLIDSTDWNHPVIKDWNPAPYYQFASGKLTYNCNYDNPNSYEVDQGQSAATNEMCMAVGYFFPATGPKMCVTYMGNSYVLD